MKKTVIWVLLTALLLAGCGSEAPPATEATPTAAPETEVILPTGAPTSPATEAVTEPSLPPATEAPKPTAPTPAEPPEETESPAPEGMYLVKVTDPKHPIYDGPGYDYTKVGTVKEAGTFTIMEEVFDGNASKWGRLKSGAGWIDVDGLPKTYMPHILLTVDFAREDLILHGDYEKAVADESEYAFPFVLYAHQELKNLSICSLELTEDGYGITGVLASLKTFTPGKPLVVWGSFPGDMSAYGVTLEDSKGTEHRYCVYISGRDGTLVLGDLE